MINKSFLFKHTQEIWVMRLWWWVILHLGASLTAAGFESKDAGESSVAIFIGIGLLVWLAVKTFLSHQDWKYQNQLAAIQKAAQGASK